MNLYVSVLMVIIGFDSSEMKKNYLLSLSKQKCESYQERIQIKIS